MGVFWNIVIGLALTFGSRAYGLYLANKADELAYKQAWGESEGSWDTETAKNSIPVFDEKYREQPPQENSEEPVKPDDYHLASSIASTIDAFVASEGVESFMGGDWSVVLRRDYGVSLSRVGGEDDARATVPINDLEEMSEYKRIAERYGVMGTNPLGHMATDTLATAILRELKKQIDK